jgi:hypothetical protein
MYSDFSADFSSGGWNTVSGATGKDLPASLLPNITKKTNFIRCVRRVGCCDFVESNVITKNPTVTNTSTTERAPCIGWTNVFTAFDNGAGAYYQWTFEGANISSSNNRIVNVVFNSLGDKKVTLTIAKNGCIVTRLIPTTVVNCLAGYGDFITFITSVNHKNVRLDWVTANETKASKYVVEQSGDGINFVALTTVVSKNGVNNVYNFVDTKPKMGRSFYRIHQLMPSDESILWSKTEKVLLNDAEGLSILTYPNPINSTVVVEVLDAENAENTEGSLEVYNALGRLVRNQYFIKNQVRYELDVSDLAAGAYIIRVRQNDGKTATAKVTKM